jgi:UDP-N-acetylmuramate--alanine ligase
MTMMGRTRRVHFVGIGGIGMSGIAELLTNLGYAVSGSDARRSETTDRLGELGVQVAIGHTAGNIGDADVVVTSSAVAVDNPEVMAARALHVPVIPRAEMLAELMRLRTGIAVAGAHGKTTTTSMVALLLEQGGLDPTAVIGGRLSAFGSNARLGSSQYMVAEADESDRSFLMLSPTFAVITNLDHEHMESYGTFEKLVDAFEAFGNKVPFNGAAIVCLDDPAVAAMIPRLTRRVITYGFSEGADVRGEGESSDGRSARCMVRSGDGAQTRRDELTVGVPGRHNLLNALAAHTPPPSGAGAGACTRVHRDRPRHRCRRRGSAPRGGAHAPPAARHRARPSRSTRSPPSRSARTRRPPRRRSLRPRSRVRRPRRPPSP